MICERELPAVLRRVINWLRSHKPWGIYERWPRHEKSVGNIYANRERALNHPQPLRVIRFPCTLLNETECIEGHYQIWAK